MALVEYQPRGELYRHSEIADIVELHPAAPTDLQGNILLVGAAGTGKSMTLRQLCAKYEQSESILPLYMLSERWLNPALAEGTDLDLRFNPREGRSHLFANAFLVLGIISRLAEIGHWQTAFASTKLFTEYPPPDSPAEEDLLDWVEDRWLELQAQLRDGETVSSGLWIFGSLPTAVETIGRAARRHSGRRLLLLIDQLDRVGPGYFPVLASVLARSDHYTVCIATRPSPCAPELTSFDLRVGDFRLVWLDADWDGKEWRDFLLTAVHRHFGVATADAVALHIDALATLVGPSAREFLEIAHRVDLYLNKGIPPSRSISRATHEQVSHYQTILEASLSGISKAAELRQRLFDAVTRASGWVNGKVRISADGITLHEDTVRLLRVMVREGMLHPTDPERFGLDRVAGGYRANAEAIVPGSVALLTRVEVSGTSGIEEQHLLSWASFNHRSSRPTRYTYFLSHAMAGNNELASKLIADVDQALAPTGSFATGKYDRASQNAREETRLPDQIRRTIADSIGVVVQLDSPRRPSLGVELGWAISLGRQLYFVCGDSAELDALPDWIKFLEVATVGSQLERHRFGARLSQESSRLLRTKERFLRDSQNESIDYYARSRVPLIIGSGALFADAVSILSDASAQLGFGPNAVVSTAETDAGNLVADIASTARQAASLAVVLSGEPEPDLLALVALGAHKYRDSDRFASISDSQKTVSLPRTVTVLHAPDLPEDYLPTSMLKAMAGFSASYDISRFRDAFSSNLSDFGKRIQLAAL